MFATSKSTTARLLREKKSSLKKRLTPEENNGENVFILTMIASVSIKTKINRVAVAFYHEIVVFKCF